MRLAILLVAAVGGWRFYEHQQETRAQAAAARYQDAIELAAEGKGEEARTGFDALAKEAPAGYALLARFRVAAELGKGNAEEGARAYDALAADTGSPLATSSARSLVARAWSSFPDRYSSPASLACTTANRSGSDCGSDVSAADCSRATARCESPAPLADSAARSCRSNSVVPVRSAASPT